MRRLWEVLPADVAVTILADRGFGDRKLMGFLEELGFDYLIRIRGNITVEAANGETRKSAQWVGKNGRARKLSNARITKAGKLVPDVVCVHAKGMKEPWCLVTSNADAKAAEIKNLYSRRWTTDIDQTWRLSRLKGLAGGVSDHRRSAMPGSGRGTDRLQVGDRGRIGMDQVGITAAERYAPAA
ncbi:transposase [Rhodovibrio sodomensis]|uniref:transposase n=1 Tax=Rhodovibrio sodomensis TaxID=1088 RepID=UPI001903B76F|nr:transposase [Rhodovibrio sodomensis]